MTERDIITSLMHYRDADAIHCPNVHLPWECDFLTITKAGFIQEFEIKLSRSDFKNDFKKPKHQLYEEGSHEQVLTPHYGNPINRPIPNNFWYVTAEGIVSAEDIPEYSGWIEVTRHGSLATRKPAPRIHKVKASESTKIKILKSMMFRYWQLRGRNSKLVRVNRDLSRRIGAKA